MVDSNWQKRMFSGIDPLRRLPDAVGRSRRSLPAACRGAHRTMGAADIPGTPRSDRAQAGGALSFAGDQAAHRARDSVCCVFAVGRCCVLDTRRCRGVGMQANRRPASSFGMAALVFKRCRGHAVCQAAGHSCCCRRGRRNAHGTGAAPEILTAAFSAWRQGLKIGFQRHGQSGSGTATDGYLQRRRVGAAPGCPEPPIFFKVLHRFRRQA